MHFQLLKSQLQVPRDPVPWPTKILKHSLLFQQLALADEKVQSFITGMSVRKIIVVPNKLVNIVVS